MAFELLFLFLISGTVCANTERTRLVGSNQCTWGPSYWCKDYKSAVECQAVQHCQENVWKSKNLNTDSCTLCELAIKRMKMDEPTVKKQFLEFLKEVCDNSGLGPLTQECKDMGSEYAPIIIKNLDKILKDPKKVCAGVGMCKAKEKRVIFASLIRQATPRINFQLFGVGLHTESQKCETCKLIMTSLDKVTSRTKSFERFTRKVCNVKSLYFKKECKLAITMLRSGMMNLMKTKVTQICINYNAGLCKVTPSVLRHATKVTTPQKLQDIGCDLCIYFMGEAEKILRNSSMTEKQFEQALFMLCHQFRFMEVKCRQMVTQYGPLLYELLSELKPYQVCQEIMMCPAAEAKLGKELRCILGASFWCATRKNAERCDAMQYCMLTVWRNL